MSETLQQLQERRAAFQDRGQEIHDQRLNMTPIEVRLARLEMMILVLVGKQIDALDGEIAALQRGEPQ